MNEIFEKTREINEPCNIENCEMDECHEIEEKIK